MKKITYCIFLLLLLPISVFASNNGVTEVASELELEKCLRNGIICKLTDDIDIRYTMGSHGDTILDLNGHTIRPTSDMKIPGGFIVVERGSKLTINDTTGKGSITTGTTNDNVWAAIQLLKEESTGNEIGELIVNGGTIEGYYYGIMGNERRHNTKITINKGLIKGIKADNGAGIYQPQDGELIINGGIIKGGTGIEIRSGSLIVNDGTIEGTASTFTKKENENGPTTNGVGITVAQHVTKNPINVSIKNGDISGQYAFYEWNPHNHNQTDIDKISIHITGGDFKSTLNGGTAIYSQDFKKFITGGKFNTPVTEYLADNAQVASKIVQETTETKQNKIGIIFIISGILVVGFLIFKVYKHKTCK